MPFSAAPAEGNHARGEGEGARRVRGRKIKEKKRDREGRSSEGGEKRACSTGLPRILRYSSVRDGESIRRGKGVREGWGTNRSQICWEKSLKRRNEFKMGDGFISRQEQEAGHSR